MTDPLRFTTQSDAEVGISAARELGSDWTMILDKREALDAMERVFDALSAFGTREQLFVLELSWVAVASHARNEMLCTPDGFCEERTRQMAVLDGIRALVQADTPDLELERLWRQRDIEGIIRYCHDSSATAAASHNRLLRIGYLLASLGDATRSD